MKLLLGATALVATVAFATPTLAHPHHRTNHTHVVKSNGQYVRHHGKLSKHQQRSHYPSHSAEQASTADLNSRSLQAAQSGQNVAPVNSGMPGDNAAPPPPPPAGDDDE